MLGENVLVPADLVLSSASGLDPDISVQAAKLQVPRIAKVRKIAEHKLHELIDKHTEHRQFGVFGNHRINILKLNLELDKLHT